MDYKAELERLKAYLQTEIDFINDDDALEDRYARQANKSTLEKVDQILKRGEAEPTNENSGLHLQRVNHCACSPDETTGTTAVQCCNICGKPTEKFWRCG